jgi:multidrug efflux system outer membrane protein
MSLVANVAQAYFELRQLDLQLEITIRSAKSFKDTYDLFERKLTGGAASKLETARAGAALTQAAAQIPYLENQIFAKENLINLLLGRAPGPVPRGGALIGQAAPPSTPAGLPSSLLERRPDVMQAEENLRASNAQVGAAKANFFPQLSLTGLLGLATPDLQKYSLAWAAGGSIAGPVFQGFKVYDNYAAAKAQWEQAKIQYQKAVVTALQDVSNALMYRRKLEQIRAEEVKNVEYLRDSVRLSTLRYMGGLANYYEVLEALQQLFPAETSLSQTELNRMLAVIQLYKALGGGWAVPKKEGGGKKNGDMAPLPLMDKK